VVHNGAEVWLSWSVEHSFGLADAAPRESKFDDDTDTHALAVQKRAKLEAELEEA
jgi:spermidine/putrescine transport system ATP-binding protein